MTNQQRKERILIVDDTALMRHTLANVLKKAGFVDILDTHSVEQAKKIIECWEGGSSTLMMRSDPAAEKTWDGPDLIFLDINLTGNAKTEQEDGFDLLKSIRAMPGGKTPFIAMVSAADPKKASAKAFELGADGYLPKPFTGNNLVEIIKLFLNRGHT